MESVTIRMRVNSEERCITVALLATLATALRDGLGLTGTHLGCEEGVCGSCTVLVDGRSVRACVTLAAQMQGDRIGGLHPALRQRRLVYPREHGHDDEKRYDDDGDRSPMPFDPLAVVEAQRLIKFCSPYCGWPIYEREFVKPPVQGQDAVWSLIPLAVSVGRSGCCRPDRLREYRARTVAHSLSPRPRERLASARLV